MDPLFPTAVLRGRRLIGTPIDGDTLIDTWCDRKTGEIGSVRYRWDVDPLLAGPLPAWVGPAETWKPWRPLDAQALAAGRHGPEWMARLMSQVVTPILMADMIDLVVGAIARAGPTAAFAGEVLDDALPKLRRDAAVWVQELHAWADTWALWAIARRPAALALLHPFALAIGDGYSASARKAGGTVLGKRFPFHDVQLVSASAQLATGLVALGIHPNLVGSMASWVGAQRHEDGGWGDGGGASDILTTLVAADLLGSLDPDFDTGPTAVFLAGAQRPDGWWRALGPETTWLTVEILQWLSQADGRFADRFRWPHLMLANRDRRTGLPFYGYFADFERLAAAVPGLARADVEVAFLDLAGFGRFNNAYGMAMGDRVLRAFAQALARIPSSMAIRDGGDEFLVVGTPTDTGLAARLEAFRAAWATEFAVSFPGTAPVAPRILTVVTAGAYIVRARDTLGIRVGEIKHAVIDVPPTGVQVDVGRL